MEHETLSWGNDCRRRNRRLAAPPTSASRREVGQRGSDGTDCAISDSPTPFRGERAEHCIARYSLGCEPTIPTLRATDGIRGAHLAQRDSTAACWSQHVSLIGRELE